MMKQISSKMLLTVFRYVWYLCTVSSEIQPLEFSGILLNVVKMFWIESNVENFDLVSQLRKCFFYSHLIKLYFANCYIQV